MEVPERILSERSSLRKEELEFDSLLPNEGEQGICGLMKVKRSRVGEILSLNKKIVFKLSKYLDFSLESEADVTKKISSLNLPFFVKFIDFKKLDKGIFEEIMEKYIETSEKVESKEYYPENVDRRTILLEYVESRGSFFDLLDTLTEQQAISIILQSLLALEIGQQEISFVDYDLHLDNILLKKVSKSFFVMKTKKDKIATFCFDFLPVIIDLGVACFKDKRINSRSSQEYTNSLFSNYHNGIQSLVFDRLNDCHHFLFPTLELLSKKSSLKGCDSKRNLSKQIFKRLFNKVKDIFGEEIDFSENYRKNLPYNFMKEVYKKISIDLKFSDRRVKEVLRRYSDDLVHILNGLVRLEPIDLDKQYIKYPSDHHIKAFRKSFHPHINNFIEIALDLTNPSNDNFLEILKEIVKITRKEDSDLKVDFSLSKRIEKLGNLISKHLTSIYSNFINLHNVKIRTGYLSPQSKGYRSPIDFFEMIIRETEDSFSTDWITEDTPIFEWNSETRITTRKTTKELFGESFKEKRKFSMRNLLKEIESFS